MLAETKHINDPSAVISCDSANITAEVAKQICNVCGVKEVYDLSKTDWVEIDIPVVIEASLMKTFSQIRGLLPDNYYYMGV